MIFLMNFYNHLLCQDGIKFRYFKKDSISLNEFYSKDELNNKRLILVGETHFQKKNNDLFLKNVYYLSKNSVINGLLLEEGYCTGYIIDQLINNNDVELAKGNLSNKEIKFFLEVRRKREYGFEKIIGVDYEKSSSAILQSILHLSKSQNSVFRPEILNTALANNWDEQYTTNNEKILIDIYTDWQRDSSQYYTFFNKNYNVFRLMIKSYTSYVKYSKFDFNECFDSTLIVSREEFIAQNIKQVLDTTEINYYGQFGSLHIPYTIQEENYLGRCDYLWESCVSYLSKLGYQNKILSIQVIYRKFGIEFYKHFLDSKFQNYSSYFEYRKRGIGILIDNDSNLFKNTFGLIIFVY